MGLIFKIMEEKIIISFTSWKKRVSYCKETFEIMLNQTLRPDKIILWLSEEEFPHKENDLPKELNDFVLTHKEVCEIRWVFKNNFVWKKFMYTLDLYPNDVILPIDDDLDYPKDYIEKMYDEYLFWGKKCPIVCYPNFYRDKNGVTNKNVYRHSGGFSLISKKFLGDTIKKWYSEIIETTLYNKWASDDIYTYAIWFNGYRYKFCDKINGKNIYNNSSKNKINPYSVNYNEEFIKRRNENLKLFDKYLLNTYNKTIEDFFEAPLIVTLTTWKKRDKYVIKMLENLKQQTKKPDKVILFLSEEEYDKTIPKHLLMARDTGIVDEILFVKGNTYAHKRWEILKNYSNCYIASVDDDIYYPKNHLQLLYENCKKLKQPICYYGRTVDYVGVKRLCLKFQNDSPKNAFYSGLSCIPPFTLPLSMFNDKYTSLRDEYCKFCDDSWIQAWLIKLGVYIHLIYEWHTLNSIDGTQENGIWETHNSKSKNGIMNKVINIANAIKVLKIDDKAKKIFNQFNINKCCDKELISNDNPTLSEDKKKITNTNVQVLKHNKEIPKIILNKSIQLKDNVNNKTITQEHNIVKETKIINNKKINFLGVEKAVSNIKKSDSNSLMTKNVNSIIKIKSKIINKQMKTSKNRVIKK